MISLPSSKKTAPNNQITARQYPASSRLAFEIVGETVERSDDVSAVTLKTGRGRLRFRTGSHSLAGAACLWLVVLSLAAGTWFGLRPQAEPVRWLVLVVSSVPSFVWPLLAFVLFPGRTFSIFSETLAWGWPALCLAIGDLNWLTGTTVSQPEIREPRSHDLIW